MEKIDKILKSCLKRKVKLTHSLLVAFLITGSIGFANNIVNKVENESAIYTSFWNNVGKSNSKKWVKSTRNETDYGKFRDEYNKNAKNDGSDVGNAIDYGKSS